MITINKTRQDKTRQDKTRQDKTRQDKTRQDNCYSAYLLCQYPCSVCKDDHNGHFVKTEFATLEEIGLKVAHTITTHEQNFSVHHGNMVIELWEIQN